MKKTLIIITAITLLFTACNADATSGLFRTATQAREAIDVKYEQILGIKDNTLYFRTSKGIYSQAKNSTPTLLVASKEGSIIQSAALNSGGTVFYKTNASDTTVYKYVNSTNPADPYTTDEGTIKSVKLLSEGTMILLTDKGFTFGEIASGKIEKKSPNQLIDAGYGLAGIYIPSDYTNDKPTAMIISYVKPGSPASYKHYFLSDTQIYEIASLDKIANFAIDETNLYILTTMGKLYVINQSDYSEDTELLDSKTEFSQYGIFYPIVDGTNIHFITNPLYSNSMTIFTVDTSDPIMKTTIKTTKDGFAAALKDTHIVSSLKLEEYKFLVATVKHGMYSVEVTPANVPDGGGTVSPAEEYEF